MHLWESLDLVLYLAQWSLLHNGKVKGSAVVWTVVMDYEVYRAV